MFPSGGGLPRSPPVAARAAPPVMTCTICMDTIQEGEEETQTTNCGHTFHRRCLREWAQTKNICPNCRQGLANNGAIPKRPNTRQHARQQELDVRRNAAQMGQSTLQPGPVGGANSTLPQTQPNSREGSRSSFHAPPGAPENQLVASQALLAGLRLEIANLVHSEFERERQSLQERFAQSSPLLPRFAQPPQAGFYGNGQQHHSLDHGFHRPSRPPAFASADFVPHRPRPRLSAFPSRDFAQPHEPQFPANDYAQHHPQQVIDNHNWRRPRSASPIKRWQIRFDGDNSRLNVEEFIFRVETLTQNTLNGDFDLLVSNLQPLFGDRVNNWFWTLLRANPNPQWDQVKLALRTDWAEQSNDLDIRRKMLQRHQRPTESFASYCQDMTQLRIRLRNPMSDAEFVENVRANLLPTIQEQICLQRTDTIAQLRSIVMKVQATQARIRSSTVHPRGRLEEYYLPDQPNDASCIEPISDDLAAVSFGRSAESNVCWNCDKPDHRYTDCEEEPKGLFCYGCGRKGVIKPRCLHCNSGNSKRVETSNTRSRPPIPPRKQISKTATSPNRFANQRQPQ